MFEDFIASLSEKQIRVFAVQNLVDGWNTDTVESLRKLLLENSGARDLWKSVYHASV